MTKRNIRPYYTITCTIGDWDISSNLTAITIMTATASPYSCLRISFNIDSKSFSIYKMHGKDDIKLKFKLMTEDMISSEEIIYDLIAIDPNFNIQMQSESGQSHPAESGITLLTVPKIPYTNMKKLVNKIFDYTKQIRPIDMVKNIMTTFTKDIELEIDDRNINDERIQQFIIPPMALMNSIRYIDGSDDEIISKYGHGVCVYKGPMFFHCRYDNVFTMWDLSDKIKLESEYKVTHLTRGGDDSDIMQSAGRSDKDFYTYSNIKSTNSTSKAIMKYSKKNKFLAKPSDDLYTWHDIDIEDIYKEIGLTDKSKELEFNKSLSDTTSYHTDSETGLEYSPVMFKSRIARSLSNMHEIEFSLDRNLAIKKLLRVGIPIELVCRTVEYIKYSGKYISKASIISFMRGQDSDSWVCNATIRAFRSGYNE